MALELRVASPCNEKWELMTGDERVRHCAECKLNVFNIEELTEAEVRALFTRTTGRVCGRIFRRADGTVLTKDCPRGVEALRRRALAALSLAISFALVVLGYRAGEKSPSCASDSWFDRVVTSRAIQVREALRDTDSFGNLIEELWPSPMITTSTTTTTGLLVLPPSTSTRSPSRAAGEDGESRN